MNTSHSQFFSNKKRTIWIVLSLFAMLASGWLINLTHILPTNIVVTKPNKEMLMDSHLTWTSQNLKAPGGNWTLDLQFTKPALMIEPEIMYSGCIQTFLLNDVWLQSQDLGCLSSEQFRDHLFNNLKPHNSATISGRVDKGSFGFLFLPNLANVTLLSLIFTFSISFFVFVYFICKVKSHTSHESFFVSLLITFGALLRAWSIFVAHPLEAFLVSDMKMYAMRADQLLNSIFNSKLFFQPIGYSLYSSATQYLVDQQWHLLKFGHLLISTLTLWVAWRACLLVFEKKFARLSLLLLCFAVPLWSLASFHLSETLYTFFVSSLAYFVLKNYSRPSVYTSLGVGVSFALGFFVKGSLSFFFPAYLIWNFIVQAKDMRIKNSILIAGSALLIAIIHGVASYQMIGQFKLGADAGGLNFVEGKCPSKHNFGPDGESWLSPLFGYLKETQKKKWPRPFSDQGYYWAEGFKCIGENPTVLLSSIRYVYYLFWGNPLWPSSYSIFSQAENIWEWFFAIFMAPFALLAIASNLRNPREPLFALALMTLGLFLAVYVFKSELRFRVPFDVILIPMALDCISKLWRKLKILLVSNP